MTPIKIRNAHPRQSQQTGRVTRTFYPREPLNVWIVKCYQRHGRLWIVYRYRNGRRFKTWMTLE